MGFSDPFSDIGNGIRHAASLEVRELPGLPHPAPSPLDVSHVLRGLHLRSFRSLVSCCAAHGISITGSGGMFSPSRSRDRQSRILADRAQGTRHTTAEAEAGSMEPPPPKRRRTPPENPQTSQAVPARRSHTRTPGRAHLHRQRTDGQGRTQGGSTFRTPKLSRAQPAQANPNKPHKLPAKENPTETMSLSTGARPESLSPEASAQSAKADQARTRNWNALAL